MISRILLSWGVELYCYIWGNAGPLLQLLQLDCLINPSCHYNCFISSCVFPLTVLIANFFLLLLLFFICKINFEKKKETSVGQDVTFLPRYHFHMVKTLVISSMKNDRFVMSNKKWQRGGTDSTNPLDILKDENLNSGAFSFSIWHLLCVQLKLWKEKNFFLLMNTFKESLILWLFRFYWKPLDEFLLTFSCSI